MSLGTYKTIKLDNNIHKILNRVVSSSGGYSENALRGIFYMRLNEELGINISSKIPDPVIWRQKHPPKMRTAPILSSELLDNLAIKYFKKGLLTHLEEKLGLVLPEIIKGEIKKIIYCEDHRRYNDDFIDDEEYFINDYIEKSKFAITLKNI